MGGMMAALAHQASERRSGLRKTTNAPSSGVLIAHKIALFLFFFRFLIFCFCVFRIETKLGKVSIVAKRGGVCFGKVSLLVEHCRCLSYPLAL
jgi:hypothetical protein